MCFASKLSIILNSLRLILPRVSLYWIWLGFDLTLFVAAGMALAPCFGFVTVLTTHWCFGYCWVVLAQCRGLLCFPFCVHPSEWVGWGLEGTQLGQLTPTDQRSTLWHVTSCPTIKMRDFVFLRWPLLQDWLDISLLVVFIDDRLWTARKLEKSWNCNLTIRSQI